MVPENPLRTLLLTLGDVTTLVGTGDAARIRSEKLEDDDDETQPAIIIEVDGEDWLPTLAGGGNLTIANVTLRCRAQTKAIARQLADAVRAGLDGYSGTVSSHSVAAVLDSQQVSFTPANEGSDRGYYDVFSNYSIDFDDS